MAAKTLKIIILLLLLIELGSAFSQSFRWTAQGDFLTLDPHSQNESLSNSINGQIYEALVGRDQRMEIIEKLAINWIQKTPTTWHIQLRPDVKFHDGSILTAEDIIYSFHRAKHPASGFRSYANAVGIPRKIDDSTIEFLLEKFNPIFLEHLGLIPIVSKFWTEKHNASTPQDFKNKEPKYTALHANGTGPFMLVTREPDVKTVFKRHSNWWGKFEGNVQEVIYTPIKSDATRTAALIAGEVDFVLDPALQDLPRLRSTTVTKVIEGMENRVIFIGMDQARDNLLYSSVKGKNPFKDVRVRKALYHAVDIESIRVKLMRGQASPTGVLSPSPLGNFNDAQLERRLPYDPPLSRKLMAEAGYTDGFEVQLDCPNNRYINDEEICVALAGMWAQIGVKIKVNALPRALYFPKVEKLDVSMYLLGWGGAITDMEVTFTPVLRNRGEGGIGYFNYGNYTNPILDDLASASSKEPDPIKRKQFIKAALREHTDQVHHIPLHRQVIPWAMRSNVNAVHRADNWLEWRWIVVK